MVSPINDKETPTLQRIAELEFENRRLESLIAELVLKNQMLRIALAGRTRLAAEDTRATADPGSL